MAHGMLAAAWPAVRCRLCAFAAASLAELAEHVLAAHVGADDAAVHLDAGLADVRHRFRQFRALRACARDLLRYFVEDDPSAVRLDRYVLRNAGITLDAGMPRRSATIRAWLKGRVPYVSLRTDWVEYYNDPHSGQATRAHIACIDFVQAVQVQFANRFLSWVIASEAARRGDAADFPSCWNWVPDARASRLVEKHPHLGAKFRRAGGGHHANRGRNGPWLIFFDGVQAFRQSQRGGMYNFYATRADFPLWFRNMRAGWLWLAAFPTGLVKARGLSSVLLELAGRLFPGGCAVVPVWDAWNQETALVENYCVGFIKDYEAELDVMGLAHGRWPCWMCGCSKADMEAAAEPRAPRVTTAAELDQNPAVARAAGVARLEEVLGALPVGSTPDRVRLRNFILFDSLHAMHLGGLLDKVVAVTFHLRTLKKARLSRYWLRQWQVDIATERLRRILGCGPRVAFSTNASLRRRLGAHTVLVLEGVVVKGAACPCMEPRRDAADTDHRPPHAHEQAAHLAHLRDVLLQYSYEECAERDLCDLPFLHGLTRRNVQTAAELYGPALVGTSKVHRLAHLYEGGGAIQRGCHGACDPGAFGDSLAFQMPTMLHVAGWTGEWLHGRVKRAARHVFLMPGDLELRLAERVQRAACFDAAALDLRVADFLALPRSDEARTDLNRVDAGELRGISLGDDEDGVDALKQIGDVQRNGGPTAVHSVKTVRLWGRSVASLGEYWRARILGDGPPRRGQAFFHGRDRMWLSACRVEALFAVTCANGRVPCVALVRMLRTERQPPRGKMLRVREYRPVDTGPLRMVHVTALVEPVAVVPAFRKPDPAIRALRGRVPTRAPLREWQDRCDRAAVLIPFGGARPRAPSEDSGSDSSGSSSDHDADADAE